MRTANAGAMTTSTWSAPTRAATTFAVGGTATNAWFFISTGNIRPIMEWEKGCFRRNDPICTRRRTIGLSSIRSMPTAANDYRKAPNVMILSCPPRSNFSYPLFFDESSKHFTTKFMNGLVVFMKRLYICIVWYNVRDNFKQTPHTLALHYCNAFFMNFVNLFWNYSLVCLILDFLLGLHFIAT